MPPVHRPLVTRDRFVDVFGGEPVPYSVALAAGFTRTALDSALRRGLLERPRRGLIAAAARSGSPDIRAAHLHPLRAALGSVAEGALASHDSAGLLLGVARPTAGLPSVVQLVSPDAAGFTAPGLVLRCSPVPLRDRTTVDGLPSTSIARTAVDLARSRPLHSALIPLDSAARLLVAERTSTTGNALRHAVRLPEHRAAVRADLGAALDALFGWAGTVAVRDALRQVEPASESAAESRSRGWFIAAGMGALAPGTPIRCGSTTYWADFCSPERRVIGEVDGWSKYGESPTEIREAIDRERRRQRELEADGWRFVRWTSLEDGRAVVSRMAQALSAA